MPTLDSVSVVCYLILIPFYLYDCILIFCLIHTFVSSETQNSFFMLQINSKYSEELAAESLEWVKIITGEDFSTNGDMDNFFEILKDGTLLCRCVIYNNSSHLEF